MLKNDKIFSFIQSLPLFKNLSTEALSYVFNFLEKKQLKAGDIIFEENEISDHIVIIYEGEAEVLKWNQDQKRPYMIESLSSGSICGEMSFIDKSSRSATVRAKNDTTIFVIKKNAFQISDIRAKNCYNQIIENICKINITRLRDTSANLVKSLAEEMKELELRTQFGSFFICIIIIFGLGSMLSNTASNLSIDVRTDWFNWLYLTALIIPYLIVMKRFRFSLKDAGITSIRLKKSSIEGLVISLFFLALFYFGVKDQIVSTLEELGITRARPSLSFISILYLPHAYIQEFMARGITQTVLQRFYQDTKGVKTIFITSLIFTMFHLQYGLGLAFFSFLLSLLLGFIYIRTYNLAGVSIVHFTLGVIAMSLGLL